MEFPSFGCELLDDDEEFWNIVLMQCVSSAAVREAPSDEDAADVAPLLPLLWYPDDDDVDVICARRLRILRNPCSLRRFVTTLVSLGAKLSD